MNRITRNGIHYIDGVPVHESVFGKDPFEPVADSYIPEILKGDVPVTVVRNMKDWKRAPGNHGLRCLNGSGAYGVWKVPDEKR